MKSLGTVRGELFHRHFGEDTFKELKRKKSFEDALVITYVGIKSAASNLRHIINAFKGKTNKLTVVLGLAWLKTKDEKEVYVLSADLEKQYQDLFAYVESLASSEVTNKIQIFKELNIYFNSRCHIKVIYADGETYIGSQNFSSTSQSFNRNKGFRDLYNNHEVVVRLKDPDGKSAKGILKEISSDELHNTLILSSGKLVSQVTLKELDVRKSVVYIESALEELNSSKDQLVDINEIIESIKIPTIETEHLEKSDEESLIVFFESIIESSGYEVALVPITKVLSAFTGEDDFNFSKEESWIELKDSLEEFCSNLVLLADEINFRFSVDISLAVKELMDCFDDYKQPTLSDFELLGEYYDDIYKIIDDADVNNLQTFNDAYGQDMNDLSEGSPGEVSCEFVDGNGEPYPNLSVDHLPDSAVTKVHNGVSNRVGKEILELLLQPLEERFRNWHEDLSVKLNDVEIMYQDLELFIQENHLSRIE